MKIKERVIFFILGIACFGGIIFVPTLFDGVFNSVNSHASKLYFVGLILSLVLPFVGVLFLRDAIKGVYK